MQLNSQNHVTDVLFVDEDGNPIEPGRENIIYVDENGSEIPEQTAVQLLESGKYVDSRELLGRGAGRQTASSGSNVAQAELSRRASSQALYQAQMDAKMQALALAEAQAQVFAKAQADLKQREEELASIEADAARETPVSLRQKVTNSAKSISSVELQIQKSQSGRRLLQPPPKKIDTKSSENLEQERQMEAQAQAQRIAELREHEMLKEKLLQRQHQIMQEQLEQRLSRQSEQSPYQYQHQQQQNDYQIPAQSFTEQEQPIQVDPKPYQAESDASNVHQEQFNSTVQTEEVVDTHVSTTPVNLDTASPHVLKEYKNNFGVGQAKFLGYLTGQSVIRNIDQLSAEDMEKIYQQVFKNQTPTQSTAEEKNDDGLDESIFSDELVEIDFGPIDAYTAALNAHLNAHKNASEVNDGKRFPAHVLACSHATFIDNQLFFGEPMYNTFESNNIENGTNGVNVELYQPDEDNQGLDKNGLSRTNTQVEYENGNYSQSQSFASIIDINSQRGFSTREMYQDGNFSKEGSRANFDSYFDSIRSKQSAGGFYANTDNLNNNHVSR